MKRGRPPIGKKAMTAAQRQARWRRRKLETALEGQHRANLQPPYGYRMAKETLIKEGHKFTRVHDSFGEEFGGVFVDGAYLSTLDVIALAKLSPPECKQQLAEARRDTKGFAWYRDARARRAHGRNANRGRGQGNGSGRH